MRHLFAQYNTLPIHLFIISFIVFLILNIIENLIHYNIGIHSDDNKFKIKMPTKRDWIRIVITMLVFAFLQGFFVILFSKQATNKSSKRK